MKIAVAVNKSVECNVAEDVCDEVGKITVPFYDWASYEPHFLKG